MQNRQIFLPQSVKFFFRKGKKNQWKDIFLTSDQVRIIEQKCKKNLQKFNYL